MTTLRVRIIISIESGATGRRFTPECYKEVTAGVGSGRLLLFIFHDLYDQRDKSDDNSTKLKQLGPCNHMLTPFSFESGAKKITPEMGNRLPLLVAPPGYYHKFPQKAKQKPLASPFGRGGPRQRVGEGSGFSKINRIYRIFALQIFDKPSQSCCRMTALPEGEPGKRVYRQSGLLPVGRSCQPPVL